MAKQQRLLFELLKEDDKSSKPESLWDYLFRKKLSGDMTDSSSPAESSEENLYSEAGERTRLYVRVNRYTQVLAGVLVLVIFFCGYLFGHSRGWRAGSRDRSEIQMAQIQKQTADSEVLDVFSRGGKSVESRRTALVIPAGGETGKEVLKNDRKITRNAGLNYLIIQNFSPEGLTTAELAKEFLARKGLETTIERAGRNYQLVSLQGFDLSNPQDKERSIGFQKQVQVIGQQFKQLKESQSVDFHGCYYQRWN
jgi:hypothetical protein